MSLWGIYRLGVFFRRLGYGFIAPELRRLMLCGNQISDALSLHLLDGVEFDAIERDVGPVMHLLDGVDFHTQVRRGRGAITVFRVAGLCRFGIHAVARHQTSPAPNRKRGPSSRATAIYP